MAKARYLGTEEVSVPALRKVVSPAIDEGIVTIPDELVFVEGDDNPEGALVWPEALWHFIEPPAPRTAKPSEKKGK